MSAPQQVLYRYLVRESLSRSAAVSEDKFKALLLKIRKGADSSVSLKQWIEVLTQLGGWSIEPFVGLVKMFGHSDKPDRPAQETAHDIESARHQHEFLKSLEVQTLPSNPQPGKRYVMDVTEPTSEGWAQGLIGFTFKEWQGTKGIRFTSPEGKIYEHMRGRFDRESEPLKLPPYKLVAWLRKETKMLEQVSNYLGLETHEVERDNAKPKTRSGAGTCPCCFRNIKIKTRGTQPPVIVLHGYKRPGWGEIHGRCYGVNYSPFELSTEGTEHLLKILEDRAEKQKAFLDRLKSGAATELYIEALGSYDKSLRKITPADPEWDRTVKSRIESVEHELNGLTRDLALLKDLISKWELLPLPEEGQKIKPPPVLLR